MVKQKILLILFTSLTINSFTQNIHKKLASIKTGCPSIIINDDIIGSKTFIDNNKKWGTETKILKSKINDVKHKYYNLSENGILSFSLNKNILIKTQRELNVFFGFKAKNKVYVNGYLLVSPNFKIAIKSIKNIEIVKLKSKDSAINIWTFKKQRQLMR